MLRSHISAPQRTGPARPLVRALATLLFSTALLTAPTALATAPEASAAERAPAARAYEARHATDDGPGDATEDGAEPGEGAASTAAYLAERLRENPVHLSDEFPRTTPLSSASRFAEQAKRTGVPTYVLVVPRQAFAAGDGEEMLAAVHDRLREKGLYVLLDGTGSAPSVAAFGVEVPAQDAATATQFELPYDAGTLLTFTHFVDVLRSGDAAERAREGLDSSMDGGSEPDDLYTTRSERGDQSFVTGLLLAGVPLLLLGVGWSVRCWRGKGPGPALLVPVAAGTAVLIGFGAPLVHDDTRSDGDLLPTAADMDARVARVADGLRDSALYADPLSPGVLTARQRARLEAHAARLDVPVRTAVVPLTPEDESAGRADRFAHLLHERLDEDGVYVVAGVRPGDGVEIVNHGARVDSAALYRTTRDLRYGTGTGTEEESGGKGEDQLYHQLDEALSLIGKAPPKPRGEGPRMPAPPVDDPVEEDELPPLYSGETVGGAVLGGFGAAAGTGAVAGVLAAARRFGPVRRPRLTRGTARARAGAVVHTAAMGPFSATPEAPARPSNGWLRRTARRELDALNQEFTRTSETVSDQVRGRAWECLDAATLLLDQEGDNRVDADADAPTLATGLALLRAGSATLRDRTWAFPVELRLCLLNPLHGQAAGNEKLKLPGENGSARARPVCAECAAALTAPDANSAKARRQVVKDRLLRLRTPGSARTGTYERYDRLPGPLGAAETTGRGTGLTADQLVRRVREQLGVH